MHPNVWNGRRNRNLLRRKGQPHRQKRPSKHASIVPLPGVSEVHCFWDQVFESIGMWSRREFLCRVAASATAVSRARALPALSASDEAFLEDLSRRAFLFFWE